MRTLQLRGLWDSVGSSEDSRFKRVTVCILHLLILHPVDGESMRFDCQEIEGSYSAQAEDFAKACLEDEFR